MMREFTRGSRATGPQSGGARGVLKPDANPGGAAPPGVEYVRRLQQHVGNAALSRLLSPDSRPSTAADAELAVQRVINWQPESDQAYQRDRAGLLAELSAEFTHVPKSTIETLIDDIEKRKARWTPYQAYQGCKQFLVQHHPPALNALGAQGTNITPEQAQWYFLQNFKTFAEVVVDGTHTMTFVNTPDDLHAEDNMMTALSNLVTSRGWDEDFSENHTILLRINNSPCKRCAERLYHWEHRDIFVDFDIEFANMYEKGSNFDKATLRLRSGGMTMQLVSVTAGLLPVITTRTGHTFPAPDVERRREKDAQEVLDWNAWNAWLAQANPPTGE